MSKKWSKDELFGKLKRASELTAAVLMEAADEMKAGAGEFCRVVGEAAEELSREVKAATQETEETRDTCDAAEAEMGFAESVMNEKSDEPEEVSRGTAQELEPDEKVTEGTTQDLPSSRTVEKPKKQLRVQPEKKSAVQVEEVSYREPSPSDKVALVDGSRNGTKSERYAFSIQVRTSLVISEKAVQKAVEGMHYDDDEFLDCDIPVEYLAERYWSLRRTCDKRKIAYEPDLVPFTASEYRTAVKSLTRLIKSERCATKFESKTNDVSKADAVQSIDIDVRITTFDRPHLITEEMLQDATH